MSTELEQRVRAAVRDIADGVPVVPPSPATIQARARSGRTGRSARHPFARPFARPAAHQAAHPAGRPGAGRPIRWRTSRWLAPALAAAAVLTVVAAVVVLPGWFGPAAPVDPASGDGPPVLPERFAGAAGGTASVADAPAGPAIATFTQGSATSPAVLVVVGADGRTYRQLDHGSLLELSHDRAHSVHDPVLSPDGTQLAGSGGYVIDLTTGEGRWFPLLEHDRRDSWGALPFLGWSPDSRLLAYLVHDGILLYDVTSGGSEVLEVGSPGGGFAFSPDGQQLAVATGPGEAIAIVDRSGNLLRELDLRPGQRLASRGSSWSPDGALLALHDESDSPAPGLAFIDATNGAPALGVISWDMASEVEILGWRSPGAVLVAVSRGGGTGPPQETTIVEVAGASLAERSWLPDAPSQVSTLQLATGLLADTEIRDAGPPRRGPPSGTHRIVVTVAAILATGLLLALVVVVRRYRDARTAVQ